MSEYVGHVIFAQEGVRLAQRDARMSRAFLAAAEAAPRAVWLGSACGGGRHGIRPLMAHLRDRLPLAGDDIARAAFTFGWVTHQACDGYLKQVYRGIIPEYHADPDHLKTPPSDARITHDVLMLRERADGGRLAPFAPSIFDYRMEGHPAASALDVPAAEDAAALQVQRQILDLFAPASRRHGSSLQDRLWAYFRLLDPDYISLTRYADAATDADPEHLRRFVHDIRFYDADDALIRIAGGEADPVVAGDMDAAMAEAEQRGSIYARVLALTVQLLRLAGDVLDGTADLDTLNPILETQPGSDGVPEVVLNASL
ncbi:MAG: hypothetical protein AAFQ53_06060 [Bacteroidota bacterium]